MSQTYNNPFAKKSADINFDDFEEDNVIDFGDDQDYF